MHNPFVHGVGGVLSADIAVPDHEREVDFYSKILTTGDAPLWRDDLMNNLGSPIIGLGARTPEYDTLPLQWMPHFQVTDVAASAACAIDMGGKELMHGKDDDGQSQWAGSSRSRWGCVWNYYQLSLANQNAPQQPVRQGCISWLSLAVESAFVESRILSARVIGWNAKSIETEESEGLVAKFEMQIDKATSAAEICQLGREHDDIPSVWLIHLPVADLVESLRRVREGGGEVIKELDEAEYAVIRDPVGVVLALRSG